MKIKRRQHRSLSGISFDALPKDANGVFPNVSLSSEQPVEQPFGTEVLRHSPDSINLSRPNIPLLWGHDRKTFLGSVNNLKLVDRKLRGDIRFSQSDEAAARRRDVEDGLLDGSISLGYRIDDAHRENDIVYVTRWSPMEVSLAPVPADHTVGFGRSNSVDNEDIVMSDNDQTPKAPETTPAQKPEQPVTTPAQKPEAPETNPAQKPEGRSLGIQEERARVRAIQELHELPQFVGNAAIRTLANQAINEGWAVERMQAEMIKAIGNQPSVDTRQHQSAARVETKMDAVDKFLAGAREALAVRARAFNNGEIREATRQAQQNSDLLSYSIVDMARHYLELRGESTRGLNRDRVVSTALTLRNTTPASWQKTSDFPAILENVASKSMLLGYNEIPETWRMWCNVSSVSDFRPVSRAQMSAFGDVPEVPEGETYTFGTFSDHKEILTLLTYGRLFGITRQALVNDDMDAFGRVPRAMGRAAARKVGDLAYGALTSNPTLNQDATAVFHATHNNLVIGGAGGPPSVATVNAMRTAMALQTDPSGAAVLNIRPAYMLVPEALAMTAQTLAAAAYDPAGVVGTMVPNPFQGTFQVISDARLDAADSSAWYMAASPQSIDTVEVAFLDGQEEPFLDSQEGWNADGVEFKVSIDVAAGVMDFRGLSKNEGV